MSARRSIIWTITRTRCFACAAPRETQQLPGESNVYFYEPRGVAGVIAPWNFPAGDSHRHDRGGAGDRQLRADETGRTVAGHGAHLLDILREAGLPDDACQLLQGGGELGAHLVRSAKIHLIAFTGSREVGLEILREAYTHRPGQAHVKRVVCEMGGKNAVIIDDDADLDEAVVHIIDSAFGYQGQKCSAASRVILLDDIYDRLLARLVEATRSLKIGPPEDPRNAIGPVIEAEAQQRIARIYSNRQARSQSASLEMAAPRKDTLSGR